MPLPYGTPTNPFKFVRDSRALESAWDSMTPAEREEHEQEYFDLSEDFFGGAVWEGDDA